MVGEPIGLRERKRLETRSRIQQAARSLFVERGYDAARMEDIAARAEVARRTLFHYFTSKDDILMSMAGGMGDALVRGLEARETGDTPLNTLRAVMEELAQSEPHDELIIFDKILRSSEAVQARKRATYILHEETLFAALRNRWPNENIDELRLLASLVITITRLSVQRFSELGGSKPLAEILNDEFALLARLGCSQQTTLSGRPI